MLKYYLSLYLLIYLVQVYGQNSVIAKQGFEAFDDTWGINTISTEPCTEEDDSWNYHTELGDILANEGNYFWGIQDLNGNCGSSGFEYIELNAIDISNYRNVTLSFAFQVRGFDNGDDIKYQVWLDDVAQPEVLLVDGADNLSYDDWQIHQMDIPNSISLVKIRISFKQNGADIAGLDNILLEGRSLAPCSDLFISEYVEGGSSSSHRNNYIELYNPSESIIDLTNFELIKYTGDNTESNASLKLSGSIFPKDTYLIEDNTETLNIQANLSSNSSVMDFNGDDKIALIKEEKIIDIIGTIGDSGIFAKDLTLRRKSHVQNPNNEFNLNEWDTYSFESIGNLGSHASYCQGNLPEIQVYGNGIEITDENNLTSKVDHSYFGDYPISKDTLIQRSFFIKNIGNKDLAIERIIIKGPDSLQFSTNFKDNTSISPKDSVELIVSYKPEYFGIDTAKLQIINTDPSESNFSFIIQGEGTESINQPLLITQYYEGSGNNKWIEITNLSDTSTPPDSYFLALFRNEATLSPIGRKPSNKKLIPSIPPRESIKFSATLNITAPDYAIDGNEIKTTVCSFTGDDILIISTSDKESSWADRIDIIGNSTNWGSDVSLIRKYGCDATVANTGFSASDWLVENISTIDEAKVDSNLRIGIHRSGSTVWKNGSWSNGKPDANRMAIIEGNYNTAEDGSIETCAIHINNNAHLQVTAKEYLEVQKNMNVEGTLEVNHEGSIMIVDDFAEIENKGSILIHKSTTRLNPLDYTYWSSPVENAQLETVFWNSPKTSFHMFSSKNYEDLDKDGLDDDNNAWVRILGDMKVGRGYISMAPNTTPFQETQKVIFKGTINNGILKLPVYALPDSVSDQHHWNLIGNPYPSSLDAELFLNHPVNDELLSKTLYFWTHSTPAKLDKDIGGRSYTSDDYAMYTLGTGGIKANPDGKEPTQFVSSCQGFFVEALNPGNIIFNNSMRTKYGNDNFFKTERTQAIDHNKVWLNLQNKEGAFSQILIGFIEGATINFDKNFDGPRLNSQNPLKFYSMMKDRPLAIQGLPKFIGNEKIKLGFHNSIKEASTFHISLDHFTGNFENHEFILHDLLLNKKHNLMTAPYSFSVSGQDKSNSRFILQFKKNINNNGNLIKEKNRILWRISNNILLVRTVLNDLIHSLEIFDLNGRTINNQFVNAHEAAISWSGLPSRGIFILRVKLKNSETMITKIIP